MALGSVGVVFGDIGTSPLYAMREALSHSSARSLDTAKTDRDEDEYAGPIPLAYAAAWKPE